ncbi:hypothetical protein KQI18_02810 [Clostridioides mangenotii]|uniref:HlyD family efflux transporter periplasmic adaptor subunit n=1 Tax=Metaclostridioides mangenotii TaxID=1540 RepID=UPI001C0F4533|nr:HlyD family efflux transporter periplasmic adaptor subunit [Clostridioides mangenotii]MBU5306709.1 hypothetical protein [Clostridioides mangenotii]
MKKINKSRVLILGLIVYLFFYVVVFFIGININLLTVEAKEFDLKSSVKGIVEKDVNSEKTFFTTYIDDKSIKKYEEGQNVVIEYDGVNIDANVYKIYLSAGKNLLRLKINDENVVNYNTSDREFDIIYKHIDCFRIPKTSVRIKNNKQGVFVVDEEYQRAKFKYLENIIHEDDNYVYVDYYKNEKEKSDTVNLHNRIILKPNSINTNIRIK